MHGNSKANPNTHHLYEIIKLSDGDTFKYGITDDPIEEEDGLSARIREQLEEMNLAAEFVKYGALILIKSIDGRRKALLIERFHIDLYFAMNGRNPVGNKFTNRN
jgi:URI fold toxin 2